MQKFSRVTSFACGDVCRCSDGDYLATRITSFGTYVDDVVGNLYHIEIMLDDDDGIALVRQFVQYAEQQPYVLEMQACRRLVQDIQRASRVAFGEFGRQFYTLALATR